MQNFFSENSFRYQNPVYIHFGRDMLSQLGSIIGNQKVLLVTSSGFLDRGLLAQLEPQSIRIEGVVSNISPNPTIDHWQDLYEDKTRFDFQCILAVGGGSVMDTAKALSISVPNNQFSDIRSYICDKIPLGIYSRFPVICVPTTAGTSSELTPWATVWDKVGGKKYSLQLPDLWPKAAIYDPILTLSLPRALTLQTGLDALSHSLESLWNKNANAISTAMAIPAAQTIIKILPCLLDDLKNIELREQMMLATVWAGLAFSNTQTAVAHAISYYLTLRYNIPHGIACSFSLPTILKSIKGQSPRLDMALEDIFGDNPEQALSRFFGEVGISTLLYDYLEADDFEHFYQSIVNADRANNSLVPMDTLMRNLRGGSI